MMLAQIGDLIDQKLSRVFTEIASVKAEVVSLKTEMASVKAEVDRNGMKARNGLLGRDDPLEIVRTAGGEIPNFDDYPRNLSALLVAGNESLPSGQPNTWNAKKSKKLLCMYDPTAEESEGEIEELSSRSRNRRLRLAKHLGISRSQLNFAQMTL